jgi:predicted O-methyltransferase YrrM
MRELEHCLRAQLAEQLANGRRRVAILAASAEAITLAADVTRLAGKDALVGIFDPDVSEGRWPMRPWPDLAHARAQVLVIASDAGKERLLTATAALLDPTGELPHVILTGTAHQQFQDPLFAELEAPAMVPSYATGHPHTRVHLYQSLLFAAAHGLSGAVVELGAFKGGTTVWLAKAVARLGLEDTKVIGFDSWDGFPPRRSLLDLYEHPRCVFTDLDAVRAYTEPYGIELVCGDIAETAPQRLAEEPILLAFIDTDNYSGTRAALGVILPNLITGGAIVFDHYWTTSDYVYTVGERLAAQQALGRSGLLHLHGTGVFVRID